MMLFIFDTMKLQDSIGSQNTKTGILAVPLVTAFQTSWED